MPFRDVLGHRAVIDDLARAAARDALPHALLFVGRRGIGKRLVAEALLAAKYCEAPRDGDACGACPACRQVAVHDHPDVEWVERVPGKRDIGIDAVRAAQDALHRAARSRRGRAVVVDGAERLTEEAQNAFLKSLEEPPPGSLIVLVATGSERLLPTIRSRCAVHRFAPLADADVARFAQSAAGARGGRLDAGAVPPALARGSPGAWLELVAEPHPAGRRAALALLFDRTESVFEQAARLVELAKREVDVVEGVEGVEGGAAGEPDLPEGAGARGEAAPSDAGETARRRLMTWLGLLELAIRDVVLLRAGAPRPIAHADAIDRLSEIAGDAGVSQTALFLAADLVARARSDIGWNVDRALVLESLAVALRDLLGSPRAGSPAGRDKAAELEPDLAQAAAPNFR